MSGLQVDFVLLIATFEPGSSFSIWATSTSTSPYLISLSMRMLRETASKAIVRISNIYCFPLSQSPHQRRLYPCIPILLFILWWPSRDKNNNKSDKWYQTLLAQASPGIFFISSLDFVLCVFRFQRTIVTSWVKNKSNKQSYFWFTLPWIQVYDNKMSSSSKQVTLCVLLSAKQTLKRTTNRSGSYCLNPILTLRSVLTRGNTLLHENIDREKLFSNL